MHIHRRSHLTRSGNVWNLFGEHFPNSSSDTIFGPIIVLDFIKILKKRPQIASNSRELSEVSLKISGNSAKFVLFLVFKENVFKKNVLFSKIFKKSSKTCLLKTLLFTFLFQFCFKSCLHDLYLMIKRFTGR